MFSVQYIEMCKAGKEFIDYFRIYKQFNKAKNGIVTPKSIFKEGDYFHHPKMVEGETKIVKEERGFFLYSTDSNSYLEEESIWIPTADQIKKGLEEINWSIGNVAHEDSPERLLVRYIESKGKKWDSEKKDWLEKS